MKRLALISSIVIVLISILYNNSPTLKSLLLQSSSLFKANTATTTITTTANIPTTTPQPMSKPITNMAKSLLHHAKITPHRSSSRGHSDHGWLNTYHSFSFAGWYNPSFNQYGSLRVLNEDRVQPNSGFPTHPHRDFEIFSYILSGELTHRDSMLKKGAEGGHGIAHSEFNENTKETVHFLQIWALPWKKGLKPRYHTRHFEEEEKRKGFVTILSPLKGGVEATAEQEAKAEPMVEGTIPIHADFVMAAGLIKPESTFEWNVGAKATDATKRKVFVHVPMTKGGKAKVRLDGREDAVLSEGDGAFVDNLKAGDKLTVESVGEAEAEVIVLDTA
ncbi:Cupin, RmlC-type [Immersiella caudata]|uniref:Cupin, RmlC-type n=1 Tax=Immersiella caudata TaxID=314043 RepID=A0AA39XG17_9PEZI|nr:Cupin, RmlC-type [Immersiella caudata]